MKKIIAQTATAVCIVFTVMMAWFLAMGYLFAGPSYGLNLTASLYGAAFGMAALQAIWFTGALIKKLPYPARIAGFGACCCRCSRCARGGPSGSQQRIPGRGRASS